MRVGIEASFIREQYGGGKEQVLLNLLTGLRDNNALDQIVVFGDGKVEEKFKNIDKNMDFVDLKTWGRITGKMGMRILFRTFIFPLYVKKYKVDIVLFPSYFIGFGRFSRPVISIPHDIQFKSNPNVFKKIPIWFLDWLYGSGFKKSDKIIAISEFDKAEMSKHFEKYAKKVERIYNPIIFNEEISEFKDKEINEKYIFANNLSYEHKNLKVLLQAFNSIKKNIPHNLHISGNLWINDEETQTLITTLQAAGRLILHNYLAREKFDNILVGADLFVNPSSFEGFGMSAVEAMFAKVPCLLADNSAVREVTMNLADYYSPATSAKALADGMLKSINKGKSPQDLEEIKDAVMNSYDYRIIANEYLKLFNEIWRKSCMSR